MVYEDVKIWVSRPIVTKSVFFCLLALLIGQLLTYLFSSSAISLTDVTKPRVEKKTRNTQSQMLYALRAPLFGSYLPKDLNNADVKQSMLNLTVVGIMYANRAEDSSVIIQSNSGKELTYHVGDSLPGGVVIKKVVPDGVFVERDGVLESLSLPKRTLNFVPPDAPLRDHND